MKTYELTYLISSALPTTDLENTVKKVETIIQEKQGVIITSHKTSAQPLAYRIAKQASGYFATLTFQVAEDKIRPIQAEISKEKDVLRHSLMVKKPVREAKERRARKPLFAAKTSPSEKKHEEVSAADLEKKLGEILGE